MTEHPTPNVDLLRATMDEILARPEKHNQGAWASQTTCGTAYCFAGQACHLSGLEADQSDLETAGFTSFLEGDAGLIEFVAVSLLGLDYASAQVLFAEDNSTADLKHYVDEICEHGSIATAVNP
jgi:hypothetical protein